MIGYYFFELLTICLLLVYAQIAFLLLLFAVVCVSDGAVYIAKKIKVT